MNLTIEEEYSKADSFVQINDLKTKIDEMRPLPPEVEGRIMQKLRLDWNYNSNAIEGNLLSYGETVAFLMEGITAKGKPLKDHLDIRGHNDAINFLIDIVKDDRPISESDIRALHETILVEPYNVPAQTADGLATIKKINLGEYKSSSNHVRTATGELHYYATPEETPVKMRELMEWYEVAGNDKNIHPVVLAALFHYKFVAIHPFDDGNGRMSRILMNLSLMQNGYPPVVIKTNDRSNYYSLLSRADNGDGWPFIEYIGERLEASLQIYLKAANGGDIDEDEDIDKELALLRMQLKGGTTVKEKRSIQTVEKVFFSNIFPFALNLETKLRTLEEYFFKKQHRLRFYYNDTVKTQFLDKRYDGEIALFLNNNEVKSTIIELNLSEYRNPENNFGITISVKVVFDQYYYRFLLNNDLLVSKTYHEVLSKDDQTVIVKAVIDDFKNQLALLTKNN